MDMHMGFEVVVVGIFLQLMMKYVLDVDCMTCLLIFMSSMDCV